MSLIKHLENNITKSSYDEAIAIGKTYKTKNGGSPKVETITRKLRNLVEDSKLKAVRKGKIIVGYTKQWKPTEKQTSYINYRVKSIITYSGSIEKWFKNKFGKYEINAYHELDKYLSTLPQDKFQAVIDACDEWEKEYDSSKLLEELSTKSVCKKQNKMV